MWTAGVGARRHAGQSRFLHQPLHPFAIDAVTGSLENNHHPAAAVEWVLCIFLVDQMMDNRLLSSIIPSGCLL